MYNQRGLCDVSCLTISIFIKRQIDFFVLRLWKHIFTRFTPSTIVSTKIRIVPFVLTCIEDTMLTQKILENTCLLNTHSLTSFYKLDPTLYGYRQTKRCQEDKTEIVFQNQLLSLILKSNDN